MQRKIVIVGGVAGGASAATRARRLSEESEIVIFERGEHVSFANCGLPYHVGGEIEERDRLILNSPASFRSKYNIDVRVQHEVTHINRAKKSITGRNLLTGAEFEESYDALVLSTGAVPLRPLIPGIDRAGHFSLRDIADMDKILSWIATRAVKRAVVVGGGYIGLEVLEQLSRLGIQLTLIEAAPQVMGVLDPEIAELLHSAIRAQGVQLLLGEVVESFAEEPQSGASTVVTRGGSRIPADLVILGLGVRPEAQLAKEAGLTIGARGGIQVNSQLQSSDPAIWAVGDVIEVSDIVTQERAIIPLAGPANRQGRIAADNIFGAHREYGGTLGTAVLRLFELTVGVTGANERGLKRNNLPFLSVILTPANHASYFPGASPLTIKLLFHPETGAILGAQIVGKEGVDKRIDVIATALKARMTVQELAELELAYAPPYGSAKDPVNIAGMAATNILQGLVTPITVPELRAAEDPFVLDVRDAKERERGAIPGSVHIPLTELRARLGELPKERVIVVSCQSGQRSYYACRILTQNGYQCRNLSGAFHAWKLFTPP